jgi:phosphopantetheinyl transferase (holo-ACP synthase)
MYAAVSPAAHFAFALAADAADAARTLTAAERGEHESLASDARRRDWLVGRLAAKRAVARALGIRGLARIEIAARPGAAPRALLLDAEGEPHALPLVLSLAHCDGRAAAAVGPEWVRLGVDVERAGSVGEARRRYFLAPGEGGGLDAAGLWTLKEAAWKALGCDEQLPFRALTLQLDGAGSLRAVALRGEIFPARATVATPWPGYVLAVCSVAATPEEVA